MPHKSYSEKLKDPRWQKVRLHVMERAGFTCQICHGDAVRMNDPEADPATLHVHHGYYERGLEPWEYDPSTLWCLCAICHSRVGTRRQEVYRRLAKVDPQLLDWEIVEAFSGAPVCSLNEVRAGLDLLESLFKDTDSVPLREVLDEFHDAFSTGRGGSRAVTTLSILRETLRLKVSLENKKPVLVWARPLESR